MGVLVAVAVRPTLAVAVVVAQGLLVKAMMAVMADQAQAVAVVVLVLLVQLVQAVVQVAVADNLAHGLLRLILFTMVAFLLVAVVLAQTAVLVVAVTLLPTEVLTLVVVAELEVAMVALVYLL
jgi:hypothetical protein